MDNSLVVVNKVKIYLFSVIFIVIFLVNLNKTSAYAWGPVTHYYINSVVGEQNSGLFWNKDVFNSNGLGPDIFFGHDKDEGLPDLPDYTSAPNPKGPWLNQPNFAYLMCKINGIDDTRSENYVAARGWGAHILADQVAHHPALFPISDNYDLTMLYHCAGEVAYDYYVYCVHGGANPKSFDYKPHMIWKTLVSYELNQEYQNADTEHRLNEAQLIRKSLLSIPSESVISGYIKDYVNLVEAQQKGYAILLVRSLWKDQLFPLKPNGADYNLTLAIARAKRELTPIGFNPSEINPETFMGVSRVLSQKEGASDGIAYAAEMNQPNEATLDADEIQYGFWKKVADRAEEQGVLKDTVEEKIDAWGEKTLKIKPSIPDTVAFEACLNEIINENIQNPLSTVELKYALFQKRFIIEAQKDPNILMDFTSPAITNFSPAGGSLAEGLKPTISCTVEDVFDEMGVSGVDPASIVMYLDGNYVAHEFNPDLGIVSFTPSSPLTSGNHTVFITVEDRAHNKTVKDWSFVIDPYPPETTASIEPASPSGLNNWYISDVTLTLSATDNLGGSGVDKTQYSLDNGSTWFPYNQHVVFSSDGQFNILYRSIDIVGNEEQEKSISFKIDKTPPSTPVTILPLDGDSLVNPVIFFGEAEPLTTMTLYDNGLPILTTICDPSGIWWVSTELNEGSHSITATSTDQAGNTSLLSTPVNVSVKYKTTLSFTPGSQTSGRYSDTASFSAKLTNRLGSVSGKTIFFKLGSQEISAITGSDGVATTQIKLSQVPGNYTLMASFTEDDLNLASSCSSSFDILKEKVVISASDKEGFYDDTLSFDAMVKDDEKDNLINGPYTVNFKIAQKLIGTSQIDQDGKASLSWQIDLIPLSLTEAYTIDLNFFANDYYASANTQGKFTLKSAKWLIQTAISDIEAIKSDKKQTKFDFSKAVKSLNDSLASKLWVDASRLSQKFGHKVFDNEKQAIKELNKILEDKGQHKDSSVKDSLKAIIDKIVKSDELLAKVAIYDAKAAKIKSIKFKKIVAKEINKAEKELAKGQQEAASGNADKAIDLFKSSWLHSQLAIKFAVK